MPSSEVMHKFGAGQLHSGSASGPTVKNRRQAIAIMLSEKRAENAHGGRYPEKRAFGGMAGLSGLPGMSALPGGLGGLGSGAPGMPMMPSPGTGVPPLPGQMPQAGQAPMPGQMPMQIPQPSMMQGTPPMSGQLGVGGYALGGSPTGLSTGGRMHVGPIVSAVGGRTDHHDMSVPSGAYVLPAAHVSGIGQGNTLNGFQILKNMFGPPMQIKHGRGAPPPPVSRMRMRAQGGDVSDIGKPVPIMAAGGEYVLSPDQVMRGPINAPWNVSLDDGHKILDDWVKRTHKKVGKEVANLPPPAKS